MVCHRLPVGLFLAVAVLVSCGSDESSSVDQDVSLTRDESAQIVDEEFAEMLSCVEVAGLSGTLRFDLDYGAGFVQNVQIGDDPEVGNATLARCQETFLEELNSYAETYPETEFELEGRKSRFSACIEEFYPDEPIPDANTYELGGYLNTLATGPRGSEAARDCLYAAEAGPEQSFGTP